MNILVPTDFSEAARAALNAAAQIATKTDSSIQLTHVLELPTISVDPIRGYTEMDLGKHFMELAENNMNQLREDPVLKGISVTTSILINFTVNALLSEVKAKDIDLIVMGTQGTSGLSEVLIGSTTQKLVRTAGVPVLAVKEVSPDLNLEEFVFVSNLYKESVPAFQKFQELTQSWGVSVQLLKVITPGTFERSSYSQNLLNQFKTEASAPELKATILNDESVEEGIASFMQSHPKCALAMATHGKSALMQLFSPSIAERLVNHLPNAVLCLPFDEVPAPNGVIFPA